MKQTTKIILLPFFILFSFSVDSNTNPDSLKKLLAGAVSDSTKLSLLNELIIYYEFSSDLKTADYYHQQRVNLLKPYSNKQAWGELYNYIGRQFYYVQNFDSAVYYFEKSAQQFEEINFIRGVVSARGNIAAIYSEQGKYKKSILQHHKLIALNKQSKQPDLYLLASSYSNLGYCYMETSANDSALHYFTIAAKINKSNNYEASLASNYFNLATINTNVKSYEKALYYLNEIYKNNLPLKNNLENYILVLRSTIYLDQNIKDSALAYIKKAKHASIVAEDKYSLISALINENEYYLHNLEYKKAENALNEGIKIAKETGLNPFLAKLYNKYAKLMSNQKNYKSSIYYFQMALSIEAGNNNNNAIIDNIRGLAESYAKIADYKTSNMFLDSLIRFQQTINSVEMYKISKELEEQYLSEKKDLELKKINSELNLQEEKNKQKSLIILFTIVALVFSSIFALLAFINYKKAKKSKVLIEEQKTMIEEKQKEIIDSIQYAKNIQKALLPSDKAIEKMLNNNS